MFFVEDYCMDIKKILFKTSSFDAEKSLPDAMIYIQKDGKIQWVNDIASEIFETSKMHLMTSNISDFIENAMVLVSNAVIMHKPVITKFVNKEMYYDMTVREIEDGYVLDFRDNAQEVIEEQQKVEDAYINRDKNNFLMKLSNDLKSPIQSIVGFSQAMADGLGGNMSEQQEKYIRIINKNSSDLMYFVGKLLELSQTESSLKPIDRKPMDIVALVNSVVRFNEQLYKDKEVSINIAAEEGYKKTINSDAEILKTIVQDLLEIILKTVDIGEISIKMSTPDEELLDSKKIPHGNYTLISVASSSMLLSENDMDCLFDPYKIVDSANRKNVLRAIVLASVKNLVQSLNGMIWVESKILKSTSFNIIIPA